MNQSNTWFQKYNKNHIIAILTLMLFFCCNPSKELIYTMPMQLSTWYTGINRNEHVYNNTRINHNYRRIGYTYTQQEKSQKKLISYVLACSSGPIHIYTLYIRKVTETTYSAHGLTNKPGREILSIIGWERAAATAS